jgi:hypothetical protein
LEGVSWRSLTLRSVAVIISSCTRFLAQRLCVSPDQDNIQDDYESMERTCRPSAMTPAIPQYLLQEVRRSGHLRRCPSHSLGERITTCIGRRYHFIERAPLRFSRFCKWPNHPLGMWVAARLRLPSSTCFLSQGSALLLIRTTARMTTKAWDILVATRLETRYPSGYAPESNFVPESHGVGSARSRRQQCPSLAFDFITDGGNGPMMAASPACGLLWVW